MMRSRPWIYIRVKLYYCLLERDHLVPSEREKYNVYDIVKRRIELTSTLTLVWSR